MKILILNVGARGGEWVLKKTNLDGLEGVVMKTNLPVPQFVRLPSLSLASSDPNVHHSSHPVFFRASSISLFTRVERFHTVVVGLSVQYLA